MTLFAPRSGTKRRKSMARRSIIAMVAVAAAIAATLTLGVGAASALSNPTIVVSNTNTNTTNVTWTVYITTTKVMLASTFLLTVPNTNFTNVATQPVITATMPNSSSNPGFAVVNYSSPSPGSFTTTFSGWNPPVGSTMKFVISGVQNPSVANPGQSQMTLTNNGTSDYDSITFTAPTFIAPPGTLTAITQTPSSYVASLTNVTWTVQFTTASAGTMTSFSIAGAPTGQGSIGIGTVVGIGAGTASYSSTAGLTYTVTTPAPISAGQQIQVQFTGVQNPAAGTYTGSTLPISTIASAASVPTIDSGYSPTLVFGGVTSVVTAQVAKALGFTIDSPSYTLALDPSIPSLSDVSHTVNLTVITNAGQGYTITMADTGMKTAAGVGVTVRSINPSSTLASTAFATNTFGVSAIATTTKSLATVPASFTGTNISGYSTTATPLVTATLPTGGTPDTIALTNRVKIDYNTAAGNYTDTITYTATPTY